MGAWLGRFRCTRSRVGACVPCVFLKTLLLRKASAPLSCCEFLKIRESQAFSACRSIRTTEASAARWSAAISFATRLTTGAAPCFLRVNANSVPPTFSRVACTASFLEQSICGHVVCVHVGGHMQQTKRKCAASHHLIPCIRTQVADRDVRRRQQRRWRRLLQFLQGPFTCPQPLHYIAILATCRPNMGRRVRETLPVEL